MPSVGHKMLIINFLLGQAMVNDGHVTRKGSGYYNMLLHVLDTRTCLKT